MPQLDFGFVRSQVQKVHVISARAELVALQRKTPAYDYLKELQNAVADIVAHCKVWRRGTSVDLLRGIRGQLRMEATILKTLNQVVPMSHLTPNHIKRAEVLRKAVELIEPHLGEIKAA